MQNDNEKLKSLIEKFVKEELEKSRKQKLKEDYSDEVVYRAFVQPFTDVVDTAVHGLKKTGATAVANVKKLALQAGAAFIPFIGKSVSKIGEEEEKKLQAKLAGIDKEYADVIKRNWDTLRTRDVSMLLFMMDPKLYLGSSLALKAPEVAFDVLDSMIDSPTVSKWHGVFKDLNKKTMPPTTGGSGGGGGGFGSGNMYFDDGPVGWESKQPKQPIIKEELTKDVINQKASVTLKRIIADKTIQRKIDNSPTVKQMQKEAMRVFIEKAREVTDFNTIDEFKSFFGPEFDKLYQDVVNKVDQEQIQGLDQELIPELKKQYVQVITTFLSSLKDTSPSAEQEIKRTISEIERYL